MGVKPINTAQSALLNLLATRGLSLVKTQPRTGAPVDSSTSSFVQPSKQPTLPPFGTANNAARWDEIYHECSDDRSYVWKDGPTPWLIAQALRIQRDGIRTIMDAGCGDGRNAIALATLGFQVTAVDRSSEAIARLNKNAKAGHCIHTVQQSLDRLPYKEHFDAIACDFVLVHIPNGEEIMVNFHKALKPNGLLLAEFLSTEDPSYGDGMQVGPHAFVDKSVFHRYYDRNGITALLNQFRIISVDQVTHADPAHTESFPRSKPHEHNSFYVVAQKQ